MGPKEVARLVSVSRGGPGNGGLTSPCAQNARAPDRVVLDVTRNEFQRSVSVYETDIRNEIATVRAKYPSVVQIDSDRALHWLRVGAQPTEQVGKLLEISGVWAAYKETVGKDAASKPKAKTPKAKKVVEKAEPAAAPAPAAAPVAEASAEAPTEEAATEAPATEAAEEAAAEPEATEETPAAEEASE